MRFFILFSFLAILVPIAATANGTPEEGYRIEVQLQGFSEEELYLAYYYGDKQFIKDTARAEDGEVFVFEGEEALPGGLYLIVLPPDNNYFQLLIDKEEQHFSLTANVDAQVSTMQFENAPDNSDFYDYLRYLESKRPEANAMQEQLANLEEGSEAYKDLVQQLEDLNDLVREYQENYIKEHPGAFSAALIQANIPIDVPEFEGTEEEIQVKKWRWTQAHYFDNMPLEDPRMLLTPILFERVNYYVHKLQLQHPDTISAAIDWVLGQAEPAEETYKFFLIHFLNEAAQSKIVGMDGVYVHLVNKYYGNGKADWTEEEQLNKIIGNAKSLEPLLIGKIAPDVTLQTRDGQKISLHEVNAEYTIFYIWRYDCGVCKKSTPLMKEFYEAYKDKGVEIFAACFKFGEDVGGCWDYIEEKEIGDWLHVVDPYNQSRYSEKYYVKSTPQLYILDKDKKIISKRIGAEQLGEVMDTIIAADAAEQEGQQNAVGGKE